MQWNTHHIEVAGADKSAFRQHHLIRGIRRLAGNVNNPVIAETIDWQNIDQSRRLHSRQAFHALFKRPVKRGDHIAPFIARP